MRTARSTLVRALLVIVAVSSAGCGLSLDPPPAGPSNVCASDGACGGARCDAELGICVREAAEAYAFTLQLVLPATDSRPALVTSAGPFAAIGSDALADVLLRDPVRVEGLVRTVGEGRPVTADVVFSPRTTIAGPALPAITVGTAPTTALTGDPRDRENDYSTQLVPGISYDVEIRPRGEDAARLAPRRAMLELEVGQRFDVQMLPSEEHFTLRGFVVDDGGVGQDGLEIRAIDTAGRLVSSIATTGPEGAEPGAFELRVDPTVMGWTLRVSAPPEYQENVAAFPTITVDPAVLANEGSPEAPMVRILVPGSDDNSVCFAGTVEFEGDLAAPAIGATVTLRSREISEGVTRLVSSYAIQVSSVAAAPLEGPDPRPIGCTGAPLPAGGFEARLVPGVYDVEIRPLEPELGVYVSDPEAPLAIVRETYGHVFTMPTRPRLSGVVQRSAEEPMIDARVRAVPLHLPPPMGAREIGAWRLNRPGETITDPQGNFRLALDVGVYDLIAEPPEGSGFPWVVRPAFAMAAREWTEPLDVRHPVAVRGHAHFEEGAPVAGAELRAYAIVVSESGAERAVPIGRASTAADGSFLLLLPPQI